LYGAPRDPEHGRYFLHAHRIRFARPSDGEQVTVESPLPKDLEDWLSQL
jgi:23S rRNA-/tRNA-specific pseudouridylate synthase